jgi:hypothetical protein
MCMKVSPRATMDRTQNNIYPLVEVVKGVCFGLLRNQLEIDSDADTENKLSTICEKLRTTIGNENDGQEFYSFVAFEERMMNALEASRKQIKNDIEKMRSDEKEDIERIENKMNREFGQVKRDLGLLKQDFGKMKEDLKDEVKDELKHIFGPLQRELKQDLAQLRDDVGGLKENFRKMDGRQHNNSCDRTDDIFVWLEPPNGKSLPSLHAYQSRFELNGIGRETLRSVCHSYGIIINLEDKRSDDELLALLKIYLGLPHARTAVRISTDDPL